MLIDLKNIPFKKIRKPEEAWKTILFLMKDYHEFDRDKEHCFVIGLNRAHKVIYIDLVSIGNAISAIVCPMQVFRVAVLRGALQIMLFHNHPSGNNCPSSQDLAITNKIKQSGDILEIQLVDHIIVTDDSYFSFADEGCL